VFFSASHETLPSVVIADVLGASSRCGDQSIGSAVPGAVGSGRLTAACGRDVGKSPLLLHNPAIARQGQVVPQPVRAVALASCAAGAEGDPSDFVYL